jgi:hypothetical protein
MNSDKFEGIVVLFAAFDVKFDDFPGALYQRVERLRLGVTTMEARERSQVVTLLIAFDDHCEFPFRLHRHIHEYRWIAWDTRIHKIPT